MVIDTINAIAAYRDNPLVEACGPILSQEDLFNKLSYLPELPHGILNVPFHVRRHMLPDLWNLHIPTQVGVDVAAVISEMIMRGYSRCRPGTPEFFRRFYKDPLPVLYPMAASVVGISGVGKTAAIDRALRVFQQHVVHEKFPGFVSSVSQLIWLKIDAPPSGKLVDLAENLMIALDIALGTDHFVKTRSKSNKRGSDMFNEWLGVANKYSLGIIVIDEIQNLFKLAPVKVRRGRQDAFSSRYELRLVEDEALKLFLSITNNWGIPVMFSGTPDGIEALKVRVAVMQRAFSHGMHIFHHPKTPADDIFLNSTLSGLCQYQWVIHQLQPTKQFSELLYSLTAGVPRICTALWIAAHWVAYDEMRDELSHVDFQQGLQRYLSPLQPVIAALSSNDPAQLARYEDMLPKDPGFWGVFQ